MYDLTVKALRAIFDLSIKTPAILPAETYFPNASRFLEKYADIQKQVMALNRRNMPLFHHLMPEQAAISALDGRDWKLFVLKAYGTTIESNLSLLPTLKQLLADHPEVLSAAISVLAPRKVIPKHKGPFRGILRFHMIIRCGWNDAGEAVSTLIIDGKAYQLSDGQVLLWDDTYDHEAFNDSDEDRIALLLDVWRTGMPLHLRILARVIVRLVGTSVTLFRRPTIE